MQDGPDPKPVEPKPFDWIADIRASFVFLTRLPVNGNDRPVRVFCWAFPIVGLAIGAMAGFISMVVLGLALSPWFAVLCGLAVAACVTGAIHEDGLSDMVDGLWGGYSPEKRLAIMRDSRIGGFGALALVITTGMKAALLVEIYTKGEATSLLLAFMAAHALSRVWPVIFMHASHPASESGLAAMGGKPGQKVTLVATLIGLGAAFFLVGPVTAITAALITAVFTYILAQILKSKLGGYNGDCLGGLQQITEILILACISHGLGLHI